MNRRQFKRLIIAVLALVAVFGALALRALFPKNRFIVRNASGVDVTDIHVAVRRTDGLEGFERTISRLAAGSSETIRHSHNDSNASWDFWINGSKQHCETHVDFWPGEGWVFEIQPDGSVKEGRDYPGFELKVGGPD